MRVSRQETRFVEYGSPVDVPSHLRTRRGLRRGGFQVCAGQGALGALRRRRKRADGKMVEEVVLLYDVNECDRGGGKQD